MNVYVAALSDDLRSELHSKDDFDTLIKTNAKHLDKLFTAKEYRLKEEWAVVMRGGNKSIREALDPYEECCVLSKQRIGLFICRDNKLLSKDVTYVVIQPADTKWRYCNQFVSEGKAYIMEEQEKRICMKEVIDALAKSYKR